MNKETLKALKGSIKKWKDIVSGKGVDRGSQNCPLCQLFYHNWDPYWDPCFYCPIYKKTKKLHCQNTPYLTWNTHSNFKHEIYQDLSIQCPTCKKLAEKELKFLKSLLPKKTKKAKNIH